MRALISIIEAASSHQDHTDQRDVINSQWTPGQAAGDMNMRARDFLADHVIDNVRGLGSVPNNQNIDYMGLRVQMLPSIFLRLARRLTEPKSSIDHIINHINQGGGIGAPFLNVSIPAEWFEGNFESSAQVIGHEGRHRMMAIRKLEGDVPVEVHLFFDGGTRSRHLTPEIIDQLNAGIVNQDGYVTIPGPLFEVM
jgi:hypothetical protein